MGIMDDMQGGADMKDRYDELRQMEDKGTLDEAGRQELTQLRQHFE